MPVWIILLIRIGKMLKQTSSSRHQGTGITFFSDRSLLSTMLVVSRHYFKFRWMETNR